MDQIVPVTNNGIPKISSNHEKEDPALVGDLQAPEEEQNVKFLVCALGSCGLNRDAKLL
jgi:hypothetical protein